MCDQVLNFLGSFVIGTALVLIIPVMLAFAIMVLLAVADDIKERWENLKG